MKQKKIAKTGLKIGKRGGKRIGSGNKPVPATETEREQVARLAGLGIPPTQIAAVVRGGMSTKTLYQKFGRDMERGRQSVNESVAQVILKKALKGNDAMLTLWAKTRLKWAEKQQVEVSGPDGGPIEYQKIERVIVDSTDNFGADRGQETPGDEDD